MLRLVPLLLAVLAGCASRPAFHAKIEAANRDLAERFNAGDYAAVAATYTDEAVILGPNNYSARGREAIDDYWIRPWSNARWSLSVLEIDGTAEMPVQTGRSILEYDTDAGRRVSDVQYMVVWTRVPDGTYRIVVDTYWRKPQDR